MLETSAVHQTPQAKNIPYQPLLIKPIFMRYVFHPKLLLQSYKHVHVTFSVTEKGLPSPTVREAGEKGKKPQQSSEVCCSESSQSEKSSAWNDLQKATWNGDAQAVRRLLCGGADVQAKNCDGWTALHRAAHKGNTRIVEILLQVQWSH